MTRRRKNAVRLVVDVDGVEIPASLRPLKGKTGNWEVRWRMHGVPHERSTGTNSLEAAKRIARQIIRGGEPDAPKATGGMTVAEFEQIQAEHFGLNERDSAGQKSKAVFDGVWRSFLAACPIRTIVEVTSVVALSYAVKLQAMSKTQNHNYRKKATRVMSVATVEKHVRTLAAAWNRIRKGHRAEMGGIPDSKLVQENPWEKIRNRIPKAKRKKDPIQFDLDNDELIRFLDQFLTRPIAELFFITSLWCAGRIEEMSCMEWSWWKGEYVEIPLEIAKGGRRRVVRVPPALRRRLEAVREPRSTWVFAAFAREVERNLQSSHEVLPFSPERMVGRLEKYIKQAAEGIGRPELTHHAFRRTAMELNMEGEWQDKETESAEKIQTTPGNMKRNYLRRMKLSKKDMRRADGLYENLTVSLQDYPVLAERLGCEPVESAAERQMEEMVKRLSPIQRRRFQKRLAEGGNVGEGQGIA
jgi:integrase